MGVEITKLREIAKRLLEEEQVDVVIGFKPGSVPGMSEPALVRKPAAVADLTWDSTCRMNLANYLTDRKDRIGVVAKGCDARNIVTHIVENKIRRDQVVIIGAPCTGMVDKVALRDLAGGELSAYSETEDTVTVTGPAGERTAPKADLLQANCKTCIKRNPVIFDELAGEPVEEVRVADRFADVAAVEAMAPAEKWAYFDDLLDGCTRCYACKNACPLCYCPTCFVDESRPQWVGKGTDPVDIRTYHFLRAFHCSGRCTDCGACEAACPMDIRMRMFTRKTIKDALDNYGWETGMQEGVRPPMDTYTLEDPDAFIK